MNKLRTLLLSLVMIIGGATISSAQEDVVKATMVTDQGEIKIELYPGRAPITANNFIKNVKAGYYNNGRIYRVSRVDNNPKPTLFGPILNIIQGGKNADMEAPAPIEHESTHDIGLSHANGVLSMARGEPGTASTEFFISIGENPGLDTGSAVRYPEGQRQGYATFGRVTEGMDVIIKIQQLPSGKDAEGLDDWLGHQTLDEEVVIERIELH